MKILQLSYSLSSGGAERFVVDLCNYLSQNDKDEIILVTTNTSNNPSNIYYLEDLSPKVRFINLHCNRGLEWKSIWRVFKIIKKEQPDIIHVHCGIILIYLPSIFLRHGKYIHTLHNLAHVCLKYNWCLPINKWLYKKRVQPITISKTCQQSYTKLYNSNNSICINNGRETLKPNGIPKDIQKLLNDGFPIFIHVARCGKGKNQQRLFQTFDRLQSEGVKFHLLILGRDYETEWTPKYTNNPQIHILGERKNVADYMEIADFFVLSSDYEGLPLTLLEAMSLGVIPICTPAGGIIDVVRDNENGYLSQNFSNEELYNKIKQALKEKGKINRERIKKEYETYYSMETCTYKYHKVYIDLIKENQQTK